MQDEAQAYLIRYARWSHVRLPISIVLGLLLIASGVYTLVVSGTGSAVLALIMAVLGGFIIWAEVTGWEIRRAVKKSREGTSPESAAAIDRAVFRFEFNGPQCRLFVDGAQKGEMDLTTVSLVQETDQVFLAAAGSSGILVPKARLTEGTPEEFREYICSYAKKYQFVRVTERMQSFLK